MKYLISSPLRYVFYHFSDFSIHMRFREVKWFSSNQQNQGFKLLGGGRGKSGCLYSGILILDFGPLVTIVLTNETKCTWL